MRNYIKNQILEIMRSLFSADKLLNKMIRQNNNVQNEFILLQDMQEAAIEIGEAIEKSQGKGLEVVQMLEVFCELLWRIAQASPDEKMKLSKSLHKELEAIQKHIKDSIPVEFEIVFLPYKVTMWDSLESVWMAAKEDSSCTAYVIPIPYFDKREDGSLGEMHYEGGLFPKYVPITDWNQYDFESRHPDIIYFHNPYDEYNFVTSVHPFFYSDCLKKYTDKLVYIPYYICSERTREENCLQKGIVNADVVIVQSDKIKNEYTKYYRESIDKNVPVNKFLALGSPKFDKVIHSGRIQNEFTIQWKQRAGNRKIILYNTHLKTFLKHGEKAIEKIETVFQQFAEREDVLLLWRPHPLCGTTLKAMRPKLYEAYTKLEKEYLAKDIGIFDESEDIYSAIGVADGYYGDSSSLLSLFGVTGKPICMQDVLVTDYERTGDNCLRFEAACIDSGKIYFANKDYNMLVKIDKKNEKIYYIDMFPGISLMQRRVTSYNGLWKEKLWMIPYGESKVYSFDILLKQWESFELPGQWKYENKFQTYQAGCQIDKYYYGFGSRQYGVIKLDLETGKMDFNQDGLEEYEQLADKNTKIICRQDCCIVDKKLYAACLKANIVLEYDRQNEKIKIYQVGNESNRYVTISYDGKAFWLTTKSGSLIRWNKETGEIQETILNFKEFHIEGEIAFASSMYADEYIWFFAYSANMNIRVNVNTFKTEKIYEFVDAYEKKNPVRVLKNWYGEGKIYFVDAYSYSIVEIDENGKASEFKISVDKEFWKDADAILYEAWKVGNEDSYQDYIHRESNEIFKNLKGYLAFITAGEGIVSESQKKSFLRFTKYPEGNSGRIIHRKMIGKE